MNKNAIVVVAALVLIVGAVYIRATKDAPDNRPPSVVSDVTPPAPVARPLTNDDLRTIPPTPAEPTRFVDVADAAGLRYKWTMPGKTPRNIEQIMGSGCAFLDYNGDGNLDILLVGNAIALYRGDGHGHFKDVTTDVGLDNLRGDFNGCAVADYDNDGFDDIFLTGYHTGALLHNEGGRRFVDITGRSGIDTRGWSTSAAWGDVDGDGRVDLYVCRYCKFGKGDRQTCTARGVQTTCPPSAYQPDFGRLYHNNGDGTFTDVTVKTGLDQARGYALGAAFADFDGGGRENLFVANDQVPSNLYKNVNGHFDEMGEAAGVARNEDNVGFAGMGVDWGDYDNDGKLDLIVMDYWNERKRVLHNEDNDLFSNQYDQLRCNIGGYPRLAFGVKWFDYDNDGWLDFVQCDGYTNDNVESLFNYLSFREPTLLYHNDQGRQFDNVSSGLVGGAMRPIVGRGLAIGDFDNDGSVDALVTDAGGKPLLLHNETPGAGHWLEVKLVGTKSNRDGLGALVTVDAGALHLLRLCQTDGSYQSASDRRVHVGLGASTVAEKVTVHWPDGHVDTLLNVQVDRAITLCEGAAQSG